jgi:hypothetical protein
VVGAEGDTEHVGNYFVAEALSLQLVNEVDEDLIRRVRESGSPARRRRELRKQNRGLPHDRIDEYIRVHVATLRLSLTGPNVRISALLGGPGISPERTVSG